MALSTVSSLHESFTSGVPLLSEEAAALDGIKDKSGSPSVSLGVGADNPALPAISEGAEHVEESQETPAKVEETTAQANGGTADAQQSATGNLEGDAAMEGAKGEDEGGDDESGTDDDAILEVHS